MKAAYRGPFPTVESRLPTWVLAHQLWTEAGEAFLSDQEHDLERLRALPVLLVFGGTDRFTPPDKFSSRFADVLPNHHSVIIPDGEHFFPEAPQCDSPTQSESGSTTTSEGPESLIKPSNRSDIALPEHVLFSLLNW